MARRHACEVMKIHTHADSRSSDSRSDQQLSAGPAECRPGCVCLVGRHRRGITMPPRTPRFMRKLTQRGARRPTCQVGGVIVGPSVAIASSGPPSSLSTPRRASVFLPHSRQCDERLPRRRQQVEATLCPHEWPGPRKFVKRLPSHPVRPLAHALVCLRGCVRGGMHARLHDGRFVLCRSLPPACGNVHRLQCRAQLMCSSTIAKTGCPARTS
jgi:hypothetical protein